MATQVIGVLSVFRALVGVGRHGLQATTDGHTGYGGSFCAYGINRLSVLSVFTALAGVGGHSNSALQATILTFAAFRAKSKVVGLTALTVLTGDARLALTLTSADVTLPIGGTQSMAVTSEEKHKTFLR